LFCFFPEIMLGQHFFLQGEVCNLFFDTPYISFSEMRLFLHACMTRKFPSC
jgi:hypothetical protein